MDTTGGLSCPDSDQRMYEYYGMSGIPHLVIDGMVHQIGADSEVADGNQYAALIDLRLNVAASLGVSVMSYDFEAAEPYITIEVEIFEDLSTNAATFLRVGVCENGLNYDGQDYHNILRDMPADTPLTILNAGEVQEVTLPLVISGEWDPAELWAFAFVQRDSDQQIHNAGSTYILPYTLAIEGEHQAVIDGPEPFGATTITHVGNAAEHTVDISLDRTLLPAGWDAHFTLAGEDLIFTTVTLERFETVDLDLTIIPDDNQEMGRVVLNIHSHSGETEDISRPYVAIRAGTELLIVADDGGAGYADDYFGPAVATTGTSHAIWERSLDEITAGTLTRFARVIWQTGNKVGGLRPADRLAIQHYVDGVGRFFLSGENVVADTFESASAWAQTVLRVAYKGDEQGEPNVSGVDGDPVSNGLELDLIGGDGALNYEDPDVIEPVNGGGGVQCFSYAAGSGAGVRVEYDETRVLTLGFGFESINDFADRNQLMQQIIDWMAPAEVGVGPESGLPRPAALFQNAPNPFNPQTTISFNLERQSQVQVAVYDLTGRLLRVLTDEVHAAGEHSLIWDGRDSAGEQVASGTYFYRLVSENDTFSRKMTMLK